MQARPEVKNRLLALLPAGTRSLLIESADHVRLRERDVLSAGSASDVAAYFPLSGMISLVSVMEDGAMVEAAVVGSEGMCGGTLLPREDGGLEMIVQAPGEAIRVPAASFRHVLLKDTALLQVQTRYYELLFRVAAQLAACNRVHSAHARLARWLLMAHDRVEGNSFPMTQEFLAQMLGVRRPTVTVAAGTLQSIGSIDYRRGHVSLRDRMALEGETCECYWTVRALYSRLFD